MHILLASEACDTKYLTTPKIRAYCMNLEGFPIVATRYSVSPKRKLSIYGISSGYDQVFDSLAPTEGNIGQYCPGIAQDCL